MKRGEEAGGRRVLVLATSNRGKLAEFALLLRAWPYDLRPIDEVVPSPPRVDEDGKTFEENALKKARAAADATRLLALGDDSGLEVDALNGQPGVRSARFARDGASDAENNAALLASLGALGPPRAEGGHPRARFRCSLVLIDPRAGVSGEWSVEGVCEGTIVKAARGRGGFGYDPLFVPAGWDRTMAELSPEEKNRISHRARAVAALGPILRSLSE